MPLYFNNQKISEVSVKTSGGTNDSDATLESGAQMLSPYTAYSKGVKFTGTIPSRAAATITPGTEDKEIAAEQYLAGKQTIKGDANLLPANIKSGVSIFGVQGSMEEVQSVEQATPAITVSSSGLITASATQEAGNVSAGTKSATKQLTTQGAKTVTPSASEQVAVESGVYTTGQIKVASMLTESIVAGDTAVLSSSKLAATISSTGMTNTGISITITKAGTYRFKFGCGRTNTSGTWTTQLYKNGSAISGATATWSSYQGTCKADVTCAAGDVIAIYGRARSTSYRLIVGQLVACIEWDTGL